MQDGVNLNALSAEYEPFNSKFGQRIVRNIEFSPELAQVSERIRQHLRRTDGCQTHSKSQDNLFHRDINCEQLQFSYD